MRCAAFYSAAQLKGLSQVELIVPQKTLPFLSHVFGDRLGFTASAKTADIAFSNRGIRDLISLCVSGKRFVSPYARAVIRDKRAKGLKPILNSIALSLTDLVGWIRVPPHCAIDEYQGYLELVGLRQFRDLKLEAYYGQAAKDFNEIRSRCLHEDLPISESFALPTGIGHSTLVFPSGTSRTFIPARWSKKHLPNAMFAFFEGDSDRLEYEKLGLKTVFFFREPGDIIELARHAKTVIATDSFCSHLIQFAIPSATILLTELSRQRIVSPSFEGKVVESVAPCHPCLKMARGVCSTCQAGFEECLNWSDASYASNLFTDKPERHCEQ